MARPASDIRDRILVGARAVFLERGVDAAPLRAIARRARTTIGMVYYYFPTKDELFLAVVEAVYARIVAELTDAIREPAPVRERMRAMYRRIGRMTGDEAEIVVLVARELLTAPARRGPLFERFWRGHIPLILGVLDDGRRDGDVAALPPPMMLIATAALAILPQVAVRNVPGLAAMGQGEALADRLVDLLFDGIGTGPRGASR